MAQSISVEQSKSMSWLLRRGGLPCLSDLGYQNENRITATSIIIAGYQSICFGVSLQGKTREHWLLIATTHFSTEAGTLTSVMEDPEWADDKQKHGCGSIAGVCSGMQ